MSSKPNWPQPLHHLGLYLPYHTGMFGLPPRIMTDTCFMRPVHAVEDCPVSQTIWAVNEAQVEVISELLNLGEHHEPDPRA